MSDNQVSFMLDTMVVDHIICGDINIDTKQLRNIDLDITFTYLLRDEIFPPDDEVFEKKVEDFFNKVSSERVDRASTLYGVGGFGTGPYGATKLCGALISALRANHINDKKDALMIEAALENGDIFVTEEKRILSPPESYPDEIDPDQILSEDEFINIIQNYDIIR